MKLRDKFWLWGHPEGRYNNNIDGYGCPHFSRMTPMEGCLYLGISNTFMVPVNWPVNRRQYNKSFKTLSAAGWECFGADAHPEKIEQIIEESKEFPNITAAVFDDFWGQAKQRLEKGLSFLEFNYMIMQSYDFYVLYQKLDLVFLYFHLIILSLYATKQLLFPISPIQKDPVLVFAAT